MADTDHILAAPEVRRALEGLTGASEELARAAERIARVPAPPFGEAERGRFVEALMREAGLASVERDGAGNVLGRLGAFSGARASNVLVVSAHLDCAYPPGTTVNIRREGDVLSGPGVGDNSSGVAVVLAVAAQIVRLDRARPSRPVLFAATVGEEGAGGLRGIRRVLDDLGERVGEVVSVDGSLGTLVTRATAVRRHRITVRGPGGHSWADYGAPSATAGLARVAEALAGLRPPRRPRTTLNIGVMRGGSAVNAIAAEAWLDLELRSESPDEIEALERTALALVGKAGAGLSTETRLTDERPWGECPEGAPLVRDARSALACVGVGAAECSGSTEANAALARGLPAITFGVARVTGAHSTAERLEVSSLGTGAAALLALVALATHGRG